MCQRWVTTGRAIVMEVESGLAAGKGGLQAGDIITTINGKKIKRQTICAAPFDN